MQKTPLDYLSGLGDTTTPPADTAGGPNWFERNWQALVGIGIGLVSLILLWWAIATSKSKGSRRSLSGVYKRKKAVPRPKGKRKPMRRRKRKAMSGTGGALAGPRRRRRKATSAKRKTKAKTTRKHKTARV